jgi:glycosyltransferase involved in cell wall biosynthesis
MKKMKDFDFTVVIPLYIRSSNSLFEKCITSVLNNTLPPTFILIILDGPVTKEVNKTLERVCNTKKFSILKLDKNHGLTYALNYAIQRVKTTWVARMDGDDVCSPNRFFKQFSFLKKNKDISLLGSNVIEIDSASNKKFYKTLPTKHIDIRNYMMYRNPFNHMSVVFKKNIFNEVGGYPEIFLREDYGLWIKFIGNGFKTANLNDFLVFTDSGDDMYKRRSSGNIFIAEYRIQSLFYKLRLKSLFKYHIDYLIRLFILSLPPTFLKYVYKIFLRAEMQ